MLYCDPYNNQNPLENCRVQQSVRPPFFKTLWSTEKLFLVSSKISWIYTWWRHCNNLHVQPTLRKEWELWPWKPLTTTNLPPSPPYQCCFATKIPLMKPQSFQTTLNKGRGEGKPFCNIVGLSIQGNWEIRVLIAVVCLN